MISRWEKLLFNRPIRLERNSKQTNLLSLLRIQNKDLKYCLADQTQQIRVRLYLWGMLRTFSQNQLITNLFVWRLNFLNFVIRPFRQWSAEVSASPIQNEDLTFLERKGRNVDYSSAQLVRAYCSKGYYDNTLKIGPFIMVYLFYSKNCLACSDKT